MKDRYRIYFLATTTIITSCFTLYSLFDRDAGKQPVAAFAFPNRIPLSQWQQVNSKAIASSPSTTNANGEIVKAAYNYRYTKQGLAVEIDTYYVVNTRGEISSLWQRYTSGEKDTLLSTPIQKIDHIGSYRLFTYQGRTYLSSCLNSFGDSTVNHEQFSDSLYHHLNVNLILNWLWGKESIRDRRCLWTTISTTTSQSETELTTQHLVEVWTQWSLWWQSNFPTL